MRWFSAGASTVLPTLVALLCMGTNGPLGFLLYLLVRAWGHTLARGAAPQ
ncbi:MAG: hypothetical protein OHK0022_40670 [Roseiflexaceae bacterium]